MEVVVTTGAIGRASSSHHQQTSTPSLFYRPDALPVAQPTVSKHWRENSVSQLWHILYNKEDYVWCHVWRCGPWWQRTAAAVRECRQAFVQMTTTCLAVPLWPTWTRRAGWTSPRPLGLVLTQIHSYNTYPAAATEFLLTTGITDWLYRSASQYNCLIGK